MAENLLYTTLHYTPEYHGVTSLADSITAIRRLVRFDSHLARGIYDPESKIEASASHVLAYPRYGSRQMVAKPGRHKQLYISLSDPMGFIHWNSHFCPPKISRATYSEQLSALPTNTVARFPHSHAPMHLLSALITLALAFTASLSVGAHTPATQEPVPECSARREFCGVTHDRVFTHYRACCPGLACVAHDHIDREVTDVRCA
ncbi:hypothetical protein DFH09DRAFT_1433581 [Mycena vulgaris]|nr:hypothetical protein DFH09DRAFT_1433581 [Mycena vulgaris]